MEEGTVTRASLAEIKAHAEETYPDECCGVVVGHRDGTQAVVRLRNVQDEMHRKDPERYPRTARIAYTPHAQDFKRAHELWEQPGNRLVAFYHSHPEHDAYFSAEDLAQATPFGEPSYPEALQVVVSVRAAKAVDAKAFSWSEDAITYVESAL
jgi:proteasome lid subunit RPN8/RPN11